MAKFTVEWAWTRMLNWCGQPIGPTLKVRVLARRGKWAWVQHNAKEPFTTLQSALSKANGEER